MDEAFLVTIGAGLGLAIGCAVAALLSHRRRPIAAGLAAGALAFVCVLSPALVVTQPDDATLDELPGTIFVAAFLLTPFVLVGTAAGAVPHYVLRRRSSTEER